MKEETAIAISREEARNQFDFWTKQLNLKHTFSFDEVYDLMMERRIAKQQKEEFRKFVMAVEDKVKTIPGVKLGNSLPLTHTFADGIYIRQLTVPPGTLTTTRIHAKEHAFFLLKGTMTILSETGKNTISAPYWGITKVGTKRIIWHHDEVIFCTVHRTDCNDVDCAEAELTADNFEEIDDMVERKKILDFIKLMKEK